MKHRMLYTMAFTWILTFSLAVIVPMEAPGAQHRQITGTVTGLDIKDGTITVTKKNKNVTLDITDKTKLTQCTHSPALSDIRVGNKVTVKYKENPGENTAKSVTIRATDTTSK